MSEIIKSPLILKKEAELNQLEKDLKRAQKTLKSYRTRMKNTKADLEKSMRETSNMMASTMDKMRVFAKEISELNDKIQASDKISDKEKKGVDKLIKGILGIETEEEEEAFQKAMFGDADENFEEQFKQFIDEQEENGDQNIDPFEQFKTSIPKEEQQNIRKTYIRLATKFHPDKANSPKEVELFHDMMQQINEAYKAGDFLTLSELENEYESYESPENEEDASVLTSFIDKAIERKARELELVKKQHQRLKDEMKNLRSSEYGSMMNMNKESYWGATPMEMERAKVESEMEGIEEVLDLLRKFEQTAEMPEELFDAVFPPEYDMPQGFFQPSADEMDEILEMLNNMTQSAPKPKKKKARRKRK